MMLQLALLTLIQCLAPNAVEYDLALCVNKQVAPGGWWERSRLRRPATADGETTEIQVGSLFPEDLIKFG